MHAYGVDERTVAQWQKRAGKHCQQVHQALVEQGRVDAQHVQADEIRVKGSKMIAWMGFENALLACACMLGYTA